MTCGVERVEASRTWRLVQLATSSPESYLAWIESVVRSGRLKLLALLLTWRLVLALDHLLNLVRHEFIVEAWLAEHHILLPLGRRFEQW